MYPVRASAVIGLFLTTAVACGESTDRSAGQVAQVSRPAAVVRAAESAQSAARAGLDRLAGAPREKSILFGDLHVHSTFSIDAFIYSLPLFAGEGAHPPADACDFARYCSQLDFFSINDHAEGLTPPRWRETKDSIRECNAVAGDPADPDLVSYVGWEWTQAGRTPEEHWGHKNVIYRELADDAIPTRPINSLPPGTMDRAQMMWLIRGFQRVGPVLGLSEYADFLWLVEEMARAPRCQDGVDVRDLPDDCRESAATPAVLFRKLREWQIPALVIPHGMAWGLHAPPGGTIANQLDPAQHDPAMQRLLEVASGHGNSEEYRAALDVFPSSAEEGEAICPAPTADFLPCCWQAGEIMRARCGDLPADECEARVEEARQLTLEAGTTPHRVFPEVDGQEWLDCDQCRDCFKPALSLRPRETAQYAAALTHFGASGSEPPLRFRWGFISSTDNHAARPGTGYKQYARRTMTDSRGIASGFLGDRLRDYARGSQDDPQRAQPVPREPRNFRDLLDAERTASFMYPGGLVAVHAEGRDRDAIWDALMRRETYGTSGPRILLWFDLLNGPAGRAPMGAEVELGVAPRFEVRASGAFVQQPGCPEDSLQALGAGRIEHLCRGECYRPGDRRHPIRAIEVVRVRPQQRAGEPIAPLIEDPWRRFECEPDPDGCVVRFEDPDHARDGRDAVYYVRALQAETPAINGANLRTAFDAEGRALSVDFCFGDDRTPAGDDCLAPVRERAWSSPIYLDWPRAAGT